MASENKKLEEKMYEGMCRWIGGCNRNTAMRNYYAIVQYIAHELYINGKCQLPNLGTFTTEYIKGEIEELELENGRTVKKKMPDRIIPIFCPEDDFINDINLQGVTKKYRERLKRNELTEHDYERMMKAEEIASLVEPTEEKIEETKRDFKEFLEKRKQK